MSLHIRQVAGPDVVDAAGAGDVRAVGGEREAELLKRYPDGETIGRAVVSNFVCTLERMRGLNSQPFLEWDDIEFFRAYLKNQPQEEREYYNAYANFYEALGDIVNAISLYQQSFAHGVCSAMNVLNTAKLSFEALYLLPDSVISDRSAKNLRDAADASIPVIENELWHIFMNLITSSIIALKVYDYVLELCGKKMDFDFNNIRPKSTKTDYDVAWLAVSEVKKELERHFTLSKNGELNPKLQINITEEALSILANIRKMHFANIKLTNETKKQIAKIISTMELKHGIIVPLGMIVMEAQKAAGVNVG